MDLITRAIAIANSAARHMHKNKAVLDDITDEKVKDWDAKANQEDIDALTDWLDTLIVLDDVKF